MKKALVIATAAIALSLTSATAFAADRNHNRGDHGRGPTFTHQDNDHRFGNGGQNGNGKWNFKAQQGPQHVQPNYQPQKNWNNNGWRSGRGRNDNWRNNDFNRFRSNVFAQKRFRIGTYRGPSGFRYHRWSYGDHLPFVFLSSNYWLPNALLYGLFSPPPGLVWVRYGDDALLVDRYTGEIVQVRYNVFY